MRRNCAPRTTVHTLLELKLERKLERARTPVLIDRTETTARDAAGAEARGERPRRLTEQAAAQRVRRRTEADLVEEIECLDTQLKLHAGADRDVAPNREVELTHAEAAKRIASERTLPQRITGGIERRRAERRPVESASAWRRLVVDVERGVRNRVGTQRARHAEHRRSGDHIDGKRGARSEDRIR